MNASEELRTKEGELVEKLLQGSALSADGSW